MAEWQLNTPVALIIFNRPDTTQKVFDAIRQAKPLMLLVIADGHRLDKLEDIEKCAATRAIIEQVDWECQVLKNYAEVNLGCKERVSSGLNWVFEIVEKAIILEDDCLPHSTFFRFCEELLTYYHDDKRIMVVSGNNFQDGRRRTEDSYYFSLYNHCWGWATWRRAWQHYDAETKLWSVVTKGGWLKDILVSNSSVKYWHKIFQSTYDEKINTWDYCWTFACWIQSGFSILPNVNLVSNIGFNFEATHTKKGKRVGNLAVETVHFPLQHPPFVVRDVRADNFTQKRIFPSTILEKLDYKLNELL